MKQKIFAALALFMIVAQASAYTNAEPIKGDSFTEFGLYTVQLSDQPMVIKGKELITYDITYTNLKKSVKVGIDNEKRCKKFIVKYPSFEMQYNCTSRGFGVKRMEPKYTDINPEIISVILDQEQYNAQELIVPESKSDSELLQLIACYFPCLLNKEIRKAM